MSTELFTPRSYPVSPRDFGSTYSCSSSEASSRLAARLERSEYKRSRGKQRLKNNYNSPRNHSKRRENRGSKRKNNPQNASAMRETRTKSEHNGVTSVWEVYRQKPYESYEYNEERTHPIDSITREKAKSWYGVPNDSQDSQTRPRSIHDTPSSDHRDLSPHLSGLSRRQEVRNSNNYGFTQSPSYSEDYQHEKTDKTHNANRDTNVYHKEETMNSEANRYQAGHNSNLDKKGMGLSRSLSSSYSSNVGSSDEREDSHGIYSAYDVAGRSPFESMLNRRYSQSSLSSSNASWQHSGSSFNYNVRDIPPLLDPPNEKTQESFLMERSIGQNECDTHFREEFRLIKETPFKTPPPVAPKPSKYSSSYTIQLHSVASGTQKETGFHDFIIENNESSFLQSHPHKYQQQTQITEFSKHFSNPALISKSVEGNKADGKLPSVREIAKRFTPTSVRHISSEIHTKTNPDETRRVKAESWPKVVSIMHQESSPSNDMKDIPPARPPYPDEISYGNRGVIMRTKEETHKTPEELASHRLSLQELIKLHEEQIAIQAKSAKTILAHAYVKRSPSDSSAGQSRLQEYNYFELQDLKTEVSPELTSATTDKQEHQNQLLDDSHTTPKPQIRHPGYEVREVKMDQSSPFKVIELTGKSFENLATGSTKEKTARVRRHRTIGIVGYRQQIDRTAGEKASTKQKRHTTVGIVSDFKEIITDFKEITDNKAESSPSTVIKDDKVIPSGEYGLRKENDRQQGERIKREDQKKYIPVKVFDILTSQEPQNQAHIERSVEYEDTSQPGKPDGKPDEPMDVSSSANYWYSSYPQKDLPEVEKYIPAISVSPDNYKKDTLTSSEVIEPQQSSSLSPTTEEYMRRSHSTTSRNLHSPVVELLPNRKGNPTVYYKAAVQVVSHSVPSDHRSSKEKVSTTSNSEQKITNFDDNLFHQSKPYSVPVAQVSPVNQSEPEIIQAKAVQVSTPPPEPPSAHEMYETRLAMWNLLPQQDRLTGELVEHHSNEGQLSFGDKSKQSFGDKSKQSHSSKDQARSPLYQDTGKDYQDFIDSQGNRFTSNFLSPDHTDEYYSRIIERLKDENHRLKEKNEAEKREFRRMYEEQKKVANAYQKLEDRYRRRVHELQDALANCTCQGSIMMNDRKTPHTTKSDKESQSSKTQSIKSGMHIFEELEEWLSEQSKNTKASKVNATSRDSLISSSSDLTGTGWDDHFDGAIDQVNGTHV